MPGNRPAFINQLIEIWSRLEQKQKLTIFAFAALVLIGLGTLVFFMNRVEYQVLYRDLNPEDAQAIATKLREEKRDYLVQGTSILVAAPQSELDKLRLDIAGSGLARSGKVGYEIFDKSQFGMTDFAEQVNLQRALEGELSRTISSLSEIRAARVHIVLPKESLFEEKKEEAKASVKIDLKNGAELSKSSIAGIKGLVAGAVPGLASYNVSIIDDTGRLLSQSIGSGDAGRSEMESGIREQLEREMVTKVVSILEPVVGKSKVNANASIDVDFASSEQTEETFNPNPPVILSQQKSEERMSSGAGASGVPGTQGGQLAAQGVTTPERMRQSEVTNYESSKLIKHTVQPKGSIRRLSIAVILDHKTVYSKGANGKIVETVEPRTQDELNKCRDLVLAAVGYDDKRGDIVTLENVPFYSGVRPEEEKPALPWHVKWQDYLLPAIKYLAFIILFLLVYLVLFKPIRKRVYQSIAGTAPAITQGAAGQISGEAGAKAIAAPAQAGAMAAGEASAFLTPGMEALEHPNMSPIEAYDNEVEREFMKEASTMELGNRKYAILQKKLVDRAKKEPESVSLLIRSWIQEPED